MALHFGDDGLRDRAGQQCVGAFAGNLPQHIGQGRVAQGRADIDR